MTDGIIQSLKNAYFAVEEQYYTLAETLEDRLSIPIFDSFITPVEKRGIPSFPLVLLFLLLLIGASLFLLLSVYPQESVLNVRVFARAGNVTGDLVDGATVEYFSDGGLLNVSLTRRGRSELYDLPASTLAIRVSKKGFLNASVRADPASDRNVRIDLLCSDPKVCQDILRWAAAALASPDPKAGSAFRTGIGFNRQNRPFNTTATLDFSDADPESDVGRLVILARDPDGNPIDATATVFDYQTSETIDTVDLMGGSGILPGLSTNRVVFVNAYANGYLPYEGVSQFFAICGGTNKLKIVFTVPYGVSAACPYGETCGWV